jgi:hypothetical protein
MADLVYKYVYMIQRLTRWPGLRWAYGDSCQTIVRHAVMPGCKPLIGPPA